MVVRVCVVTVVRAVGVRVVVVVVTTLAPNPSYKRVGGHSLVDDGINKQVGLRGTDGGDGLAGR